MEEMLLKFGLSALFGLIIGLDRELRKKPLGLKTCLVLSVSSCLLTIISIQSAYEFPKNDHVMMDPLRLAAQIVSGVGFIGAGVILKKSNEIIVGLTTAAMIWGASGIGIAIGAGYYIEAGVALLIILIGVDLFPPVLKKIGPRALRLREMDVMITVTEQADTELTDIFKQIELLKIRIKNTRIMDLETGCYQLQLRIETDNKQSEAQIFKSIHSVSGVSKVDIRSY